MKPFFSSFFTLLLVVSSLSLLAQHIDNPKTKWRFKTDGPIRSKAILTEDQLYFGSSDGFLYTLNKEDGSLKWKFPTSGAIVAAPVVTTSAIFLASRDNHIYALEKETGKQLWKHELQQALPANYGDWEYFASSPVVSGSNVLVGAGDGKIYALDAKTGKVQWQYQANGRIRATPLVKDGVVYQPSHDGFVYVLNEKNGKLLWKFETLGASYKSEDFGFDRRSIYTQPVIEDGTLIFGSRDGNVYAVDLETHKEKWKFSYGPTWAMAISIADDAVYVGWSTNNLASAIDLQTGKEIWQTNCGAHVYNAPLVLDSTVYVGSADGNLYQLKRATGEKNWTYSIGQEIYSSIQHDNGTLYFGSDDGYFYAVEDGENPALAVFLPTEIEGNEKYLIVDQKIAPYLTEKGFAQLDSAGLYNFLESRISDKKPSVVVFALPIIPKNIIGEDPKTGMVRKYLDSGGKIIWMGDIPNYYSFEGGNFQRGGTAGIELLEVNFSQPDESGNYYSKATQEGLNLGVPTWVTTSSVPVHPSDGVIPLAIDEFGRVSMWMKKFSSRTGSGFISCRTWSWSVPIKDEDLELIHRLAVYGLE